ncbi:eukaryotic translation initiation factor 3 subunit C-like protein [Tanacetum coccineum]|uniref:Eukaryotic translation initiation factor 3 subunit C-like protein n=1 Tax=Tanacetum coccineum TaxID=301880 RepID=A0ABQ5HPW5_9ASTR
MDEELEESEVIFVEVEVWSKQDYTYGVEKPKYNKLKRKRKKQKKSSLPISIPEKKSNVFDYEESAVECGLFEEDLIPPHVISGRRLSENVAYSIRIGIGETLKIRDFIFKMTVSTIHVWIKCVHNMFAVLDILAQYPNILVDDSVKPAFLEKVDEEFIKSLQCIHPDNTREYVERLRDEPLLFALAQNVHECLERFGNHKAALQLRGQGSESEVVVEPPSLHADDERTKTRTMLRNIYHHAISDEFSKSRLLGLCAFRAGLITEASRFLSKLYLCDGSVKDLLAQEVSQSWKTSQREHIERGGQMPYYMHINLELLEAIHQTCWLLTDHSPENFGDHAVMAGTRALGQGEFDKSYDVINSLDVSRPLRNREKVMAIMLKDKIKKEDGVNLHSPLFFHDVEQTRLHALASQLTEKHTVLAESNERAPEAAAKLGGGGSESLNTGIRT